MSRLKAKGCLFLASSLCDGVEDNNIKQVTTLLLNKEANPNTLIPSYGVTPFHLVIGNDSEAFAEEVTKLFLRHGGNPNVRSTEGLTPVHVAAAWGRITVLELLLANGGDALCLDDEGRSPFHYAFDGKYYQAIVVLGKYCDNPSQRNATNCKITFDKLVVSDGNTIAEYTAADTSEQALERNDGQSARVHYKNLFNSRLNNVNDAAHDNEVDADTAELEIRRQMDEEKSLVNEIIVKLSNSLQSNSRESEATKEERDDRRSECDASWSSAISSDNSNSYGTSKFAFALKMKARKRPVTPKYRRQNGKLPAAQNNNLNKMPMIAAYDPNDTIISRSPNFLASSRATPKRETFLSPTVANSRDRASRLESFTPCVTRNNQSFRFDELHLGKETARSTPRRRKRFIRQHSSLGKLRKNSAAFRSSESPDSTTNSSSLSPEQNSAKKFDYRLNANLAIKLHEKKYDDDDDGNEDAAINCQKENDHVGHVEKLKVKQEPMEDFRNDLVGSNPRKGNEADATVPSDTVNTFRDTLNTLLSSFRSASSVCVQEQYKIEDKDEGIAFLERRIYTLPPCNTADCTSPGETWPTMLNLTMNMSMSNVELRRKLCAMGENPGPVTHTTRQVYLKCLAKLETERRCTTRMTSYYSRYECSDSEDSDDDYRGLPIDTTDLVVGVDRLLSLNSSGGRRLDYEPTELLWYGDWAKHLQKYKIMEGNAFAAFNEPSPSRKWREGTSKNSFTYLLLDPRVTKDLPCRAENQAESTVWRDFVSAIFYVGKGTRNRPYSHLKDAFHAWVSKRDCCSVDRKIDKILKIWASGRGVVCLHVFQNTIPVEAYTREAAIIDALQVQRLTNKVTGTYYGIANTWSNDEKRKFGRYLLYRAMQIFLHEGERQMFPQNL